MRTFHDRGVSGKLVKRPAIQEMLDFLRQNRKAGPFFVVIDDINRLAREVLTHIALRKAIADAGGLLVSPSMEFGDDCDSQLVEIMLAGVSQHQRQKNGELNQQLHVLEQTLKG